MTNVKRRSKRRSKRGSKRRSKKQSNKRRSKKRSNKRSKNSKIKKSKPKTNKLVVVLQPYIIYPGGKYGFSVSSKNHKTKNKQLDLVVDSRIQNDYTNIKGIFLHDKFVVKDYKYDGKKVYVTLSKKNRSAFVSNDKSRIREIIEMGPDTWMEGNIIILTKNELQSKKYKPNKYSKICATELGVIITEFKTI